MLKQWTTSVNNYMLLGETNELKNRYMLIGYVDNDTPTSTPTSMSISSENVKRLVFAIGREELRLKEMMAKVGLKDRKNFIEYSLTPAMNEGLVCMKYPDSPRHPRQRYLLTIKGVVLLEKEKETRDKTKTKTKI